MPRRPLLGNPHISCDNACHRRRNPPSGGTDYAVPVGTDVLAPVSGFYHYNDNAATGYGLRVAYNDRTIYLSHLSSRVARSGQWFDEGALIAKSGGQRGAPGAGSSTGPHLHAEVVIAGTREGMEEWLRLVNGPSWSGDGDVIPIEPEPEIPAPPTIEEREISMSRPWMIQERDTTSTNHGIVVLMMDNGLYRTLTGPERDAYAAVVGPAFPCTVPGRFGLFLRDAEREREFLRVTSGGNVPPPVIDEDRIADAVNARLSAQLDALPARTIEELRAQLTNAD